MASCLRGLVAFVALTTSALASDHRGQVTFAGLPVPGATVTATRGGTTSTTVTDEDGAYRFELSDGPWTIDVAMLGFAPMKQEVVVAAGAPPATFALTIVPFDQIAGGRAVRNEIPAPAAPNASG
ncbi:MAG TPA: carboxypeptidase-like regulatory domain-containing protein, partial [Vicinamibacterales bacterium]